MGTRGHIVAIKHAEKIKNQTTEIERLKNTCIVYN